MDKRFLVAVLVLCVLVDVMFCLPAELGRKKKKGKKSKTLKKPVEVDYCHVGGKRYEVGARIYQPSICGYCRCVSKDNFVCDNTVCDDSADKVDPDTCDGRASWTEWKDQTGCFMYFCDNTGQRLTSQTLC